MTMRYQIRSDGGDNFTLTAFNEDNEIGSASISGTQTIKQCILELVLLAWSNDSEPHFHGDEGSVFISSFITELENTLDTFRIEHELI